MVAAPSNFIYSYDAMITQGADKADPPGSEAISVYSRLRHWLASSCI